LYVPDNLFQGILRQSTNCQQFRNHLKSFSSLPLPRERK
jgi:hypothetical protein